MQVLQVQLEIGSDPADVGRARGWARSRLAGAGVSADESLAENLVLLVSELVTNAIVHAGAPAVLRLLLPTRQCAGAVRVEVLDASGRPPRQRRAEGGDTNGRGLELVSCLADRWGWQQEGTGKRVWCELDSGPVARPTGAASAAGLRPPEPCEGRGAHPAPERRPLSGVPRGSDTRGPAYVGTAGVQPPRQPAPSP
ncbi:ATP-binding protein [Streptomyces sp. AJS327]|uniref:ATP-binding protein n=1 Tax=Streptomyces sp. AJS327 TaxID=2545265 RepID=UPI0015DE9A7D|nr:ATP-binding protein [Streptomyces sp. AJS327]MBA0053269.1 ATP-binding protein [Streptomyces sp. AJS327]